MPAYPSSLADRIRAAQNRSTPPEVLAHLAADRDRAVRAVVAGNLHTPASVLAQLAHDD